MVCYILSVVSAVLVYALRRRCDSPELRSFNLMLLGGTVFGFVDHLWNGELFSSANPIDDLVLGTAIVASISGIWALIAYLPAIVKKDALVV